MNSGPRLSFASRHASSEREHFVLKLFTIMDFISISYHLLARANPALSTLKLTSDKLRKQIYDDNRRLFAEKLSTLRSHKQIALTLHDIFFYIKNTL